MCVCVCVCVFTYTTFLSIICVWQEELSLIASHQLMNNLQVNAFWKDKTLWKVNFWYHWISHLIIYLIIWYNKGSSFEHITSDINIHFDECVSLMAPECNVFVRLWYQIGVPVKKPQYVSDLSKPDALLHKTHIKVLLVPRPYYH